MKAFKFFPALFLVSFAVTIPPADVLSKETDTGKTVALPGPRHKGKISVEEAIYKRRAVRKYRKEPLSLADTAQILWASAGSTIDGLTGATRAYPSAGASYPIEVYLVSGKVAGLDPGLYRYNWEKHSITMIKAGDFRDALSLASMGQEMIKYAPISIILSAKYGKTTNRYGDRGRARYVPMDAGSIGQNIHLQTEALGLGTVIIGAFKDPAVKSIIGYEDETPLYIMPIGKPEFRK